MGKWFADKLQQGEAFLVQMLRQTQIYGRRRMVPGVRTLAGILCIIGGFLGFLPILGYWMAPIGILLIGLDIPALRRPIATRIAGWNNKVKAKSAPKDD